eukprot:SAG31_NODE_9529_length_1263_cov_1.567010_1_plen_99_part_00
MHLRWRAHEQRMVNKTLLKHDREKADLYRQIEQRKPYDVARLEAEVKALRTELRRRGTPPFSTGGAKRECHSTASYHHSFQHQLKTIRCPDSNIAALI